MLTIRLQRTGKRHYANYRVVVAEKTAHVTKRFHEVLGSYNPHTKDLQMKNPERLQHWIDQHVEFSPTVNNLLVEKGLLKADKVKAFNIPKKPVVAEEAPSAPAPAAASEEAPAAEAPETTESPETLAEAPETPVEAAPEASEEAPTEAPAA
jgi:small subunit ribosomal protein S16